MVDDDSLDYIFHPRSIALAGITLSNPDHWTRIFLYSLLEFEFPGPIYLVNPKGGEIEGLKVFRSLAEIHGHVDNVIATVSAGAAPGLLAECFQKGVKFVHFCTSGFSEIGTEEGIRLEAELVRLSRETGIRVLGPNCMGLYCPESHLSYEKTFPKESGPVGYISQSGSNTGLLIDQAKWRGVRFSKVVSYGNACDLDESDFIQYLTDDPATKVIALYIEGVKDGKRFRQVLESAVRKKPVILLKAGFTEGGSQAVASHTGALTGSDSAWGALCKQLGIIRVNSITEMIDAIVTLIFMLPVRGRNGALIGFAGGQSVLITDEFEKRGLRVPPFPGAVLKELGEFATSVGNILKNPVDLSQVDLRHGELARASRIISGWEGVDFVVFVLNLWVTSPSAITSMSRRVDAIVESFQVISKPVAIVCEPKVSPEEASMTFDFIQRLVSAGLPVYYSFAAAARAINWRLNNSNHNTGDSLISH